MKERGDRAEGFFGRDLHGGRHAGQDRRLEEQFACRRRLAAKGDSCALGDGVRHVFLDLFDGLGVDQRACGHTLGKAVANLQLTDLLCELLGKGVVDAGLDIEAVGADAGLAGIAIL